MYRLMIVDDEAEIREGLLEVMDFPSLGFEVVGEAENGADALRLAETLRPDLVISDIRMPLMDGLTMAQNMRKFLPTVQFLILSGHDDFEYARQAIGIAALSYVLKPISRRELLEEMRDVRRKMDQEFERQTDLQRLRAHFEASLPVMREMLLNALATGDISADAARAAATRYGLRLDSPAYALALIRACERPEVAPIKDPELMKLAVKNIADEVLTRRLPGHTFHLNGILAALLLLPNGRHDALIDAVNALEEIQKSAERYTGCPPQIGVSAPVTALFQLKHAAEQAQAALSHADAFGAGEVVSIGDVTPSGLRPVVVEEYLLKSLANAIRMGDVPEAEALIDRLMAVPKDQPMAVRDYRAYLLEIVMTFMRIGRDLDIPRPPEGQADIYERLLLCPPVDVSGALLHQICGHFARTVAENRVTSSRLLINEAMAYLDEHYMDEDMTIERICKGLHISPSYLSAIFKKELSQTFLQILTEKRMDKAMSLLVSTDLKTAEIAQRVGIPDPSYFSYSFKKHFSLSPSQARKGVEHA